MPFLAPVAGAALGSIVTNLLVGTALTIGATLLSQALAPKPQAPRDPGTSLTMQIGGDNPLSFFVGLGATAGHRTYAGTWGTDGETPNAYFVDVLELANVPIDGLNGVYVNGERATLHTGQVHAQYGIPVSIGRKDGKDHLWVKFYDGRQTTPDAYLRSKFGGLAERPYDADMVGYGTPYAVVTTRYNRDLWQSGAPKLLFEVRGLRLYDIRKDGSVGGVGAHRRNNPATWEWTENPYVIGYNVAFMGVYFGDEWLWGLQNLPALRLPQSAWIAAMNEADRVLAAWENQRQFTIGGEITVDMEPASVLEEIAKSSMGRFIESAGSYKPRCGAPGTSVYSFGEADLLITDPRTVTPFPGLENTHNTVEASYVEPGEAWGTKAAPVQSNASYIASDGNRRLSAGLSFPMVHRNEQVQRLSYSYLEDGRRFRQFQASFHPITWLLEPGDVIDGTILSEGYDGKTFEILSMSGRRTFVQTMTLREIDPSDFDPPSSARQPWSVGPIQTIYPPTQPATGITFAAYEFYDNDARARRPAIEGFYQGALDDVQYFRVQVRKPGEAQPFFDERFDYRDDVVGEASQPFFSQAFTPELEVLVRGKYVPYSARETDWSIEYPVTIPNIRYTGLDIEIDELAEEIKESVAELDQWARFNTREEIERQRKAILLAVQGQLGDYNDRKAIRQGIFATTESNRAEWRQDILVATGPGSAIVSRIEELRAEVFDPVTGLPATAEAVNLLSAEVHNSETGLTAVGNAILSLVSSVPGASAEGLIRIFTSATAAGEDVRIALSAATNGSAGPANAALYLTAGGGNSELLMVAGRIAAITSSTGTKRGLFVVEGDNVYMDNARIRNLTAGNIAAGAITADRIDVQDLLASNAFITNLRVGSANIENLAVGRLQLANGAVTDFPGASGGPFSGQSSYTFDGPAFTAPPGPFLCGGSISASGGSGSGAFYQSTLAIIGPTSHGLVNNGGQNLNYVGIAAGLVSGGTYRMRVTMSFSTNDGPQPITLNAWSVSATIPRK